MEDTPFVSVCCGSREGIEGNKNVESSEDAVGIYQHWFIFAIIMSPGGWKSPTGNHLGFSGESSDKNRFSILA